MSSGTEEMGDKLSNQQLCNQWSGAVKAKHILSFFTVTNIMFIITAMTVKQILSLSF